MVEKSLNELAKDQVTETVQKLKVEAINLKRKLRAAELLVTELRDLNDDYLRSRFKLNKQKSRPTKAGVGFKRVAFGDTHGCHIDTKAWAAFLRDMEQLQPREIVHGGDIIECGGWLAQHHTTNYVAETEFSFADDVIMANAMLDQLQEACPRANIIILEGNHDARIEKWCVTQTMRSKVDSKFLMDHFSPYKLLHLEKRNIQWIRRSVRYGGASVPGTVKLGKCWFTHPQTASKHHAANMVTKYGGNVVYFHTHRSDYYPGNLVNDPDAHAAWCPGCMCKLQHYWRHTEPSNHSHGYHLQYVQPNETFLGINVPILNGLSYISEVF